MSTNVILTLITAIPMPSVRIPKDISIVLALWDMKEMDLTALVGFYLSTMSTAFN